MAPPPREIEERIRRLAEGIASSEGLDLVDLEVRRGGRKWLVRVFIDHDDGVGAEDCAAISRQLGTVLDVEDFIPRPYVLEVSSPGMDRPLRAPREFRRNLGRLLRVKAVGADREPRLHRGRLVSVGEESVVLDSESGGRIEIPMGEIEEAKVRIDWSRTPARKEDRKE